MVLLGILGASGTAVGLVAGSGELAGYPLRLWSGRLADRTHRYWTITIVGYAVNLLAAPLLALAGHWSTAALLMVVERVGKHRQQFGIATRRGPAPTTNRLADTHG